MSDEIKPKDEKSPKDAGLMATKEQVKIMADVVSGAHESYGMAFGHDCIPNPLETELANQKKRHQAALAKEEEYGDLFKRAYANAIGVETSRVYINNGQIYIGRT